MPINSNAQIISTIAGSTAGYSGDGGPATAARMNSNWGMAINHTTGMIYVSDFNNCAVRRISMATGIITTFAGTGICGFSGDGGPANVARINGPTGVTVDNIGNVYIADIYNHRIRKVDLAGVITTYAGNGVSGAAGDGGPATLASIGMANGTCMDNSNNLFIPDYLPETVRKVTAGTGIINTFAGIPFSGGFSGDGGPALSARLNLSNDVAADNFNNIYISDWSNRRIRKVNTSGIISTFCGTGVAGFSGDGGPATAANTLGTMGFDFDCDNNMVICDVDNHRVRYINTAGIITTIAGAGGASLSGDGGLATSATMNRPVKAVFDAIGNIYISDRNNNRVRKVTVSKTVCMGSTVKFCNKTGTGTFASSNTAVATVNAAGIVTGITGGTATITLTLPAGYFVTGSVTVTPTPSAITGPLSLCVGATTSLSNAVAGGTWSITPVTVATISPTGVVTGIASGTATVSYSSTCGIATAIVTVNPAPGPISGNLPICSGSSITLSSSTSGGTWSIAPVSVATISTTGVVTGIATGTATVSYAFGCGSVTTIVTVTAVPAPIVGNAPLCVGNTITLSNTASGGTWSIAPVSVATISPTGVVGGISGGTAIVSYTTGCGAATVIVTVGAAPGPISGNVPICAGSTITLSNTVSGGTWAIAPSSVATITSGGIVTGVATGTATVSYANSCGAVSVVVTVNATPGPIMGNSPICAGNSVTLSNSAGGGTWSIAPVSVAIISATGVVTGVSGGTAIVTYSNACGSATAIVTVNPMSAPILGNAPVCAGSTITLTNAVSGGTWNIAPASVATISAAGVVTGISAGTATVSYTSSCGIINAIVTVTPAPGPITGNTPVCAGGAITLSNAVSGGTWSIAPASVATISATGIATGISSGTAVVSYTNSCGSASIVVTIASTPVAIIGNGPLCAGSTLTLSNTVAGGTWSCGPSSVASISAFGGVVSGVAAGTAIVTYTNVCGSVTTTITVSALPEISGGSTVCPGGTITLSGSPPGGLWGCSPAATATISPTGVVTGINEGVAIVSYTSGFCGAAVAHITVAGPPKPVAGSNGPLCEGQTLMLKAWHSTPGGTYTWAYPFGGGSSDQNPVIPNVTVAASGIYTVTYTIGGCTAFALLNETVYPYVVLTNVTPGQTIAYGGEVQLFATGATYYNWAPPLTLSNPNINNPLATPLETTVYTVYGMNDAGCPDTATVTITIDDDGDEFIPTAFSPNGDGLNDVFRIRGMRNKKLVDFSIYNRWGERVYQNTYAPGEGWDGTYKGTPQDLGVYNYCIIVGRRDGTLRIYKGDVTLVR